MLERGSSDPRQPSGWCLRRIVGTLPFAFLLSVAFAWVLPTGTAAAQSEDQVKAAFLFNFVRYVEWPDEVFEKSGSRVKICTLDAEAFGSVVSQVVSGKSVGDRELEVESIESLEEVEGCHLLYLGSQTAGKNSKVASTLAGAPVFTVSDSAGFAERGGMANFFRADNKMRFEMNPTAAKQARLKISSRLLRLARIVK